MEDLSGNSQKADQGAAMGLDMFLTQRIFVGAAYDYREVTGTIDLTIRGEKVPIDLKRVSYIVLDAGNWCKANAVHKWFVDNCQDGHDACQEAEVSYAQLQELRALCAKVIETRDHHILPTQGSCFLGYTEADDCYFGDLAETIKIIDALDPDGEYYYQSSW